MENELNYLSIKIEKLEEKINYIEKNMSCYRTESELNFYNNTLSEWNNEKEILENIINQLMIKNY